MLIKNNIAYTSDIRTYHKTYKSSKNEFFKDKGETTKLADQFSHDNQHQNKSKPHKMSGSIYNPYKQNMNNDLDNSSLEEGKGLQINSLV